MNDNYIHTDNNLIYVTENILASKEMSAEYETLFDDYNSQYDGCNCEGYCQLSVCKCLHQSHGTNYESLTSQGKEFDALCTKSNAYPIYECTDKCPCNPKCGNRVVQNGPIEGLVVRPCQQKGLGLFTSNLIPSRTFICEYSGEVLTKSQAQERTKENEKNNCDNYIFCLNEHANNRIQQTFVDPSRFGNIGRYINHSCDPNSSIVPVRCDSIIPKLAIFACRDISSNEEITFSYGSPANQKECDKAELSFKKCHCNTERCEGYLPLNGFDSYSKLNS